MDDRATIACTAAGASLAAVSDLLHAYGVPEKAVNEVVSALALALRLNLECTPGAYGIDELIESMRREMLHLYGAPPEGVTVQ